MSRWHENAYSLPDEAFAVWDNLAPAWRTCDDPRHHEWDHAGVGISFAGWTQ